MSYELQWNRTKRWLARIEAQPPVDHVTYDDFIWAFFQNCWHLRDWIHYDLSLPEKLRKNVMEEWKRDPSLLVCSDLANGAKHLALDRPRDGAGAKHSHRVFEVVAGDPSQTKLLYYVARGNGERLEAISLARACMRAWGKILRGYGVQPRDA
jgi:hypothetical protein